MSRLRLLAACATLVAPLFVSATASAFCQKSTCNPDEEQCEKDDRGCVVSGYGVTWKEYPALPYSFGPGSPKGLSETQVRAAFRRAASRWEKVKCDGEYNSLQFVEQEDVDTTPTSGKEAPKNFGIYFRNDKWPGSPDALAITRLEKGSISGKVTGASMEFNASGHAFGLDVSADEYDLEAVMVHEIGHYLGLDHSTAEGSVMAPVYCNGEHPCTRSPEDLRMLGADDIAGVCALYPPKDTPVTMPASSCQASPSAASGSGFLGFGIAAALASLARRRVRR